MATDEIDKVWRQIRATRSAPPSAASAPRDRRRTYVAALEQAEQLLRAADDVGPASAPLLLFYGLSQAGRAIAAAAVTLTGHDWRLDGHGINATSTAALAGPNLAGITLVTDPPGRKGSFARLSQVLDSPLWPAGGPDGPVQLGTLWDCIPTCKDMPLNGEPRERRTPLFVEHRSVEVYREPSSMVQTPVCDLPAWVASAADGHAAIAEYLQAFELPDRLDIPYVLDSPGVLGSDGPPKFSVYASGRSEVQMNWQMPEGRKGNLAEKVAFVESFTHLYRGRRFLFPAFTEQRKTIHPLMAWWGVLFTLSMLARYQPDRWGVYIDVDSSPHAVALEQVLATARATVPELVLEALREVQ